MATVLGLDEIQAAWRVQAVPNLTEVLRLIDNLIGFVGMTPDGRPTVTINNYPNGKGKGGYGCQVHVYQPLVESWAVVSTWPDHGFTRVNLSSCKPFNPQAVESWLTKELGPTLRRGNFEI